MSLTTSEMTPADIAAVTGNNGNGMFGGADGSWWIIILFLFIFAGWNNNGFGGYGGGQVGDNYVLASDMSQLARQISDSTAMTERKLDGVNNGLCSGFYQEAQLINGVQMGMANNTAALTQAITTQGFETRNAIVQDTIANMQGFNGVNAAIKDCCCQTQQNLKDVNYNLANQANGIITAVNQGFCQTNFNAQQNTRDLIDNQNMNARAILDAIQSNKIEQLKERIAEQNQQINALNLARSQAAQNEYLIEKLNPNPCPKPAYVVQPPTQVTFPNYNNGCGCGC
ncbi:MAG: hypothetical protein MJ097_00690 [Dorea sp.]|nr:hypothetical protein [Dorea sp.]